MSDLQRLQEQAAFQEMTIEQLNDAVSDQQKQITKLSQELRLAVKMMQQFRSEGSAGIGEGDAQMDTYELPPHY